MPSPRCACCKRPCSLSGTLSPRAAAQGQRSALPSRVCEARGSARNSPQPPLEELKISFVKNPAVTSRWWILHLSGENGVKPLPPKLACMKRQSLQHDGNDFSERQRLPMRMPGRANWSGIRTCAKSVNWYYTDRVGATAPEEFLQTSCINCQEKAVSHAERALANPAELPANERTKRRPRAPADFSLAGCRPLCHRHGAGRILFERDRLIAAVGHARDDQNHRISVVSRVIHFLHCFVFSFRNFAWEAYGSPL